MSGRGRRHPLSGRCLHVAAVGIASTFLAACATPAQRADGFAAAHAFSRSIEQGAEYAHVVYRNGVTEPGRALHVYLEGDGSPYLDRWTVAADPTPRRPLMLELMALDPAPAVYVGRPCYLGLAASPPCRPFDWTLGRFAPRIVESLATVVAQLRDESGSRTVELFGHSGGGALAVLLARRIGAVTRVVTLAGNLDPDAWARLHGYSPLLGSARPLEGGPLAGDIVQLHLAGSRDRVLPPALVERAAGALGAAEFRTLADVSHVDGWARYWPGVLQGH